MRTWQSVNRNNDWDFVMDPAAIFDDPQFEKQVERIVRRIAPVDPWLSPKEIARYAQLSKDYVLRALRTGAIEHVGAGRLIRARRSTVDRWLATKGTAR